METERGAEALAATQSVAEAARDAIERARAQRDELLVLASHDVKNAIGILDSALGMLEESPEQGPMLHGMMRRATHRLGILVRAMGGYGLPESLRITIGTEEDLQAVLDSLAEWRERR